MAASCRHSWVLPIPAGPTSSVMLAHAQPPRSAPSRAYGSAITAVRPSLKTETLGLRRVALPAMR